MTDLYEDIGNKETMRWIKLYHAERILKMIEEGSEGLVPSPYIKLFKRKAKEQGLTLKEYCQYKIMLDKLEG